MRITFVGDPVFSRSPAGNGTARSNPNSAIFPPRHTLRTIAPFGVLMVATFVKFDSKEDTS